MQRIGLLSLPATLLLAWQIQGQEAAPGGGGPFIPLSQSRPNPTWPADAFPSPGDPNPPPVPSEAPIANSEPELFSFDYRQADLRLEGDRWQIHVQGTVLKDFGAKEADAQEALRVIRLLRLTHYGVVGQPRPVLEYWLADGRPPQIKDKALRLLPIDLNSLRLDEHEGQWRLRDGKRLFFTFGASQEDALRALGIIRHFGFKQVGYIGRPSPSMIYFLGNGPGEEPSPNLLPPSLTNVAGKLPLVKESQPSPNPAGPILRTGFSKGAGPLGATLTTRLDPQLVVVRREQNDWKLFHGAQVLANFGPNANLAREAMSVLQQYRCTEMCQIGTPPTFSYFLVNGQAPRGLKLGLSGQPFHPQTVSARALGKNWLVCDGDRPLVSFGERAQDAQELVQAIRRYQFDHLCQVGFGDGRSLTILVRSR
jgi:hypothetical protein